MQMPPLPLLAAHHLNGDVHFGVVFAFSDRVSLDLLFGGAVFETVGGAPPAATVLAKAGLQQITSTAAQTVKMPCLIIGSLLDWDRFAA